MPVIRLPSPNTKRWTGIYPGSYLSSLYKTFNIDLDLNRGKINLSRASTKIIQNDTTTLANVGLASAFLQSDADHTARYYGIMKGGKVFKTSGTSPITGWTEDTTLSDTAIPYLASDMTVHEQSNDTLGVAYDRLFLTRSDTSGDIAVLNQDTTFTNVWNDNFWVTTKSQTKLKNDVPHPVDVFNRKLSIGDGNWVHTIDKNDVVNYKRLVLPVYYKIEHIFHTPTRQWFLCSHTKDGIGGIIEWDGFSTDYLNDYPAHSTYVLSGIDYQGTPIVLNDKGIFLEYNGGGFNPLRRNGQLIGFPIMTEEGVAMKNTTQASVLPRGMTVADGLIYINAGPADTNSFRHHSGIWCLDPVSGIFYNKYSIGQTGAAVDYGQQEIHSPGAILAIPPARSAVRFLIGGIVYDVYSGTTLKGIWSLATSVPTNRGYFVTDFLTLADAEENFETMWVKNKKFFTSTNRIVVKAKGVNSLQTASGAPLDKTITWTAVNKFTVTLGATDDALAVGDEVEILAGDNAGYLAHITVITGAHAALQTVTIDESTTSSTSAASARFDRWTKLGTISSTTDYKTKMNLKGIKSPFIQFKVGLFGVLKEVEIDELLINVSPNIRSKI